MLKKIAKFLLAGALAFSGLLSGEAAFKVSAAQQEQETYKLYPNPHEITYEAGSYILRSINVIYDDAIDEYTKVRLQEVADLKGLSVQVSDQAAAGMTNIYVGVKGSNGAADQYIMNTYAPEEALFENTDAYFLKSDNNVIAVLGKDTDAAFYGLTTLYHVLAQMDSLTIRNFTVEDHADVVSRGFIEGYYGNPWSTEDRAKLMTWGGYYKLNSYFYAPKDDPKHNANWRELYTEEEIETKIKPLAEAGNASKCRFVFALHPFMSNAISFNSMEEYENDLAVLQAKFKQAIDAGARQIAILADDAANFNNTGNLGGNNYKRLLEDMSEWLKEMQQEYPDLKLTLPFVPVEYGGYGESYYSDFPDNVQIVMTGGRVWGEVSNSFTTSFTDNVGRGPYMWINWPCTDNSKKHLIMGGYTTFLQVGVDSSKVQGIVLNPMQQSEPSKVAIFGNACYSWNIWESHEVAEQTWDDAFSFVDHNSAVETDASNALRELSKHMINQAMDTRVTALEESVELGPKLEAFKTALQAGTLQVADVEAMIDEFEVLQDAAEVYRSSAGNIDTRDQIVYWLNCWDDTTEAAIAYLQGVKSALNGDTSSVIAYNTKGSVAFARSKTHGFHYVDHTEYAEVGVQHIVPFINTLATYVSGQAETAMDPDKVIQTFITNRTDNPTGSTSHALDGDDSTNVSYRDPVWIYEGDYVGVSFNKVIDVTDIRFLLGNGKNHFEHSKLQYTEDGKEWKDMELTGMENDFTGVLNEYLEIIVEKENLPKDFQAKGIRLVATANNVKDAYLDVHEIQINKRAGDKPEMSERYRGTVTYDGISVRAGSEANYFDDNSATEVQLAKGPYENPNREQIDVGATLTVTFDEPKTIGSFRLVQGQSASADVFTDAGVEYRLADSDTWVKAGSLDGTQDQTINLGKIENVAAVRIYNQALTAGWVRISEIEICSPTASASKPIEYNVIRTSRWKVYQGSESNLYDGNDDTYVWYDPDGDANTTGDDFLVDDFLGYDLGKVATLESAYIVVGHDDENKLIHYTIETSLDKEKWVSVKGYENYTGNGSGKDILNIDLQDTQARYIRIRNLQRQGSWGKFSEFTVQEKQIVDDSTYLYTNLSNTGVGVDSSEEGALTMQGKAVTLQKGDYIGVQLEDVRTINDIQNVVLPENTVLETAIHPLQWTAYEKDSVTDARFVRIRAVADDVTVSIDDMKVVYAYIGARSVESDFANQSSASDMRTGTSTVENVFDGDLSTQGTITGPQDKGKFIIFDLGQVIDMTSLRYYIVETQLDYPRAADFYVSETGMDDSWVKVMHIGPNDDTAINNIWDSTTAKDSAYLIHDSSNPGYMYADADGLGDGMPVRYIKVSPTQTYSHRWLAFSELQINGGAYISTEMRRDVLTDAVEEDGKIPSNMLDGDYTTVYKSSEANSGFTYRISEADMRTARIIQNGQASHAAVSAKVLVDGNVEDITLGSLDQAVNEFALPEDVQLVEIRVEWEGIIPEIAEIKLTSDALDEVSYAKLEELLTTANQLDVEGWTLSAKEAFADALAIAQKTLANPYATQNSVDTAAGALQSAMQGKVEKADVTELQTAFDNKKENIVDGVTMYTNTSYGAYLSVMNRIESALQNADDLSKEEAEELLQVHDEAVDALEYSAVERELAEVMLENDAGLYDDKDNYTEMSYVSYTEAKAALEQLIKQDKQAERVNPQTIDKSAEAYEAVRNALVDITKLNAVLSVALDESLYTEASWEAYATVMAKGEAYKKDGTAVEIAAVITEIEAARVALVYQSTADVEAVIEEMSQLAKENYTKASYAALQEAITKAEADKAKNDDALNKTNIEAMKACREELVDIQLLNDLLADVNDLDRTAYTRDSLAAVDEAVAQAEDLCVAGSKDEVAEAESALEAAFAQLVFNAADLDEYRHGLTLLDETMYTEASYAAYKEAYDALMALESGNTSVGAFEAAKNVLDEATAKLKLLLDEEKLSQLEDFLEAVASIDRSKYSKENLAIIDATAAKAKAMLASKNFGEEEFTRMEKEMAKALNIIENNMQSDGKPIVDEKPADADKDSDTPATAANAHTAGLALLFIMAGMLAVGTRYNRKRKVR